MQSHPTAVYGFWAWELQGDKNLAAVITTELRSSDQTTTGEGGFAGAAGMGGSGGAAGWVAGGSGGAPDDAGLDASDAEPDSGPVQSTVATGLGDVKRLYAHGDTLFYTSGYGFESVAKTGGTPQKLMSEYGSLPGWIVADDAAAYWTFETSPSVLAKVGSTVLSSGQSTIFFSAIKPSYLTHDASYLFYIIGNDGNTLQAIPKVGGTQSNLAFGNFRALVHDAGTLYFGDKVANAILSMPVVISPSPPAPTTVVPGVAPLNLALDQTHLYWIDPASGVIARAPRLGGTVQTLAQAGQDPRELTVDDGFVYWTTQSAVMAVAKTGGSSITLADQRPGPSGVAVDDSYVFWGETGSIIKRVKPQ